MLKSLALLLLRGYKLFISPLLGQTCRFSPSCSSYSMQAIERFWFFRGRYLSGRVLLSCHPRNPGGYDPIPETCCPHSSHL